VTKGFYRRRRGILEHLQTGQVTLFDAGLHDFVCLNAQSRLNSGSSIPPGVWVGSARKIWLLTSRRESERRIQRSLEKLERMGWIRRFHVHGQRGDYPILVARFVVSDCAGNDFIVCAEETTDWHTPALKPYIRHVMEPSAKRRRAVGKASPLLQDLDTERNGDKPSAPAHAPSQEACALAALLREKVLENDSKAKITKREESKWAQDAALLMRRDGRAEHEIRAVIEWCQQDSFWKTNILSMGKLREKFHQLWLKSHAPSSDDSEGARHGAQQTRGGSHGTTSASRKAGGAVVAPPGKYEVRKPDFDFTT